MKRYLSNYRMILLCALLLGMTDGGTLASTLTLEDIRGRKTEVEVREVTDDSVTFLHLGNNQEYTLPLNGSSDATQSALEDFVSKEVESTQKRVDSLRVPSTGTIPTTTTSSIPVASKPRSTTPTGVL